jgi:CubicO group peptidase (beta-lactamase class C family)
MPLESRLTDVLAELDMLMEQGIQERAFPGATLWVGWRGETLKCSAYGKTADQTYEHFKPVAVTTNTLYDLASLTKVVATTIAILRLIEQGRLQLDDLICTYLPQFGCDAQKATITVRHVLTHTSGLPGPCRLYQHCHGPDQILAGICQQELVFPPGTRYLYNDLGFILLGEVLPTITSLNLDEYTRCHIFEPLGMHDTLFTPPATLKPRIAPTEYVAWRGGLVHGVVHDENAAEMDGVAGHAGLFSTVEDLARLCIMLLQDGLYDAQRILQPATIAQMTTIHVPDPDEAHGLGWVIAAPYFMGRLAGDSTFGHTGFTGTSLLIDPARQLAAVFLSNCVCPQRGFNLNPYRRGIANALARLFDR